MGSFATPTSLLSLTAEGKAEGRDLGLDVMCSMLDRQGKTFPSPMAHPAPWDHKPPAHQASSEQGTQLSDAGVKQGPPCPARLLPAPDPGCVGLELPHAQGFLIPSRLLCSSSCLCPTLSSCKTRTRACRVKGAVQPSHSHGSWEWGQGVFCLLVYLSQGLRSCRKP